MPDTREVILYTLPGCCRCEEARSLLRARAVPFREINVLATPRAARLIPLGAVPAYPLLEIDRVRYSVADPIRLQQALAALGGGPLENGSR